MSWEEHQDAAFESAIDAGVPLEEAIHEVYGFDPGTKRGQTGILNEIKRMEPGVLTILENKGYRKPPPTVRLWWQRVADAVLAALQRKPRFQ